MAGLVQGMSRLFKLCLVSGTMMEQFGQRQAGVDCAQGSPLRLANNTCSIWSVQEADKQQRQSRDGQFDHRVKVLDPTRPLFVLFFSAQSANVQEVDNASIEGRQQRWNREEKHSPNKEVIIQLVVCRRQL